MAETGVATMVEGGAARRARAAASRTDRLLHGPILPTLLSLAVPNMLLVVAQTSFYIAEPWYIGRLGTPALAGLALVYPTLMLMQMMSSGAMGGGVSSAVARALGAGDRERAQALIVHAAVIAVGMAALFGVVMLGFGTSIFRALGGRGEALRAAEDYAAVIFAGAVFVWLANTLASVLRGTGNMTFPALVLTVIACLQVAFAGATIFGAGPIPALGVQGSAAALVGGFAVAVVVLFGYLASGRAGIGVPWRGVRLRWVLFRDILRVGAIACLSSLFTSLTIVLVTGLVGRFGAETLAGYGLGARLEFIMVPAVFAIGGAMTAMVGTNVGAGNWPRARRIAWTGAALAAGLTGTVGFVFGLFPQAWIGLFSQDPGVHAAGAAYLSRVGFCYAFFGFGLSLYFASQGAARMLWPTLAGVARLLLAAGGGWLLLTAFGAGPEGLFTLIGLAMTLFGTMIAGSIALGTWTGPGERGGKAS